MEALDPRWRKSSYSDNGGECIEVADCVARARARLQGPHRPRAAVHPAGMAPVHPLLDFF